jgi:pimeloyl-ACP methyl ester carboxylesterase
MFLLVLPGKNEQKLMLNYQIKKGNDTLLIFVHGNSQSAESWSQVSAQSVLQDYTLIAVDLPGHGKSFRSKEPLTDYSLKGLSKHLDDFIKNFESTPFMLVAFSLGANVVGELQNKFKNCKGIVLAGPSIIGKNLQVADVLQPNPNTTALFTENPCDAEIELLITDLVCNTTVEWKKKIKADIKITDPLFRSSVAASVGAQDYSDELLNIEKRNIPLAVVFGSREKLCFTDYLDKTDLKKWKDKTILIPDSGHCIQYDQPENLAAVIAEFAKEVFKP